MILSSVMKQELIFHMANLKTYDTYRTNIKGWGIFIHAIPDYLTITIESIHPRNFEKGTNYEYIFDWISKVLAYLNNPNLCNEIDNLKKKYQEQINHLQWSLENIELMNYDLKKHLESNIALYEGIVKDLNNLKGMI